MQTIIGTPRTNAGPVYHPGNRTIDRHQQGNRREKAKKTSTSRRRNSFLTGRILPVSTDYILTTYDGEEINLTTAESYDYLYRSALNYARLLGTELPYKIPARKKRSYRMEIVRLYEALESIVSEQVNFEVIEGRFSFCLYRFHNWPDDTLFWMPIDFTNRLRRGLRQIVLEFIRRFVRHHRLERITELSHYEMIEDCLFDYASMDKRQKRQLMCLEKSYKKGGRIANALKQMSGRAFCTDWERKLETFVSANDSEKELLELIQEGKTFIGKDSPSILSYEYDWEREDEPDFFPIELGTLVALTYSIDDPVVKQLESFLNQAGMETYALTPVSTWMLTPHTKQLFPIDDFPEKFAEWFDRFTYHVIHHF